MAHRRNCIFCKIAESKVRHNKFWENGSYVAFLDDRPQAFGHTLVIPKEHVEYIFSLRQKNYINLLKASERVAHALKKATKCKRVALRVYGFEVNHVHVHLIPFDNIAQTVNNKRIRRPSKERQAALAEKLSELLK